VALCTPVPYGICGKKCKTNPIPRIFNQKTRVAQKTNPKCGTAALGCVPFMQNKANLNIFLIFTKKGIYETIPFFNAIALHLGLFGIDNPYDSRYNLA